MGWCALAKSVCDNTTRLSPSLLASGNRITSIYVTLPKVAKVSKKGDIAAATGSTAYGFVKLSISDTEHYNALHYRECQNAECHVLFIFMLNVALLIVIMLSV